MAQRVTPPRSVASVWDLPALGKEFLNECMHPGTQLCPLWVPPTSPPLPRGPLLRAPPPPLPRPLSPHAGPLTTGRSAPFPPPARRTSARTAAGTSTRLGTAEDGQGTNNGAGGPLQTSREETGSQPRGAKAAAEREARSWEKLGARGSEHGDGPGKAGPEKVGAAQGARCRRRGHARAPGGPSLQNCHFTHNTNRPNR